MNKKNAWTIENIAENLSSLLSPAARIIRSLSKDDEDYYECYKKSKKIYTNGGQNDKKNDDNVLFLLEINDRVMVCYNNKTNKFKRDKEGTYIPAKKVACYRINSIAELESIAKEIRLDKVDKESLYRNLGISEKIKHIFKKQANEIPINLKNINKIYTDVYKKYNRIVKLLTNNGELIICGEGESDFFEINKEDLKEYACLSDKKYSLPSLIKVKSYYDICRYLYSSMKSEDRICRIADLLGITLLTEGVEFSSVKYTIKGNDNYLYVYGNKNFILKMDKIGKKLQGKEEIIISNYEAFYNKVVIEKAGDVKDYDQEVSLCGKLGLELNVDYDSMESVKEVFIQQGISEPSPDNKFAKENDNCFYIFGSDINKEFKKVNIKKDKKKFFEIFNLAKRDQDLLNAYKARKKREDLVKKAQEGLDDKQYGRIIKRYNKIYTNVTDDYLGKVLYFGKDKTMVICGNCDSYEFRQIETNKDNRAFKLVDCEKILKKDVIVDEYNEISKEITSNKFESFNGLLVEEIMNKLGITRAFSTNDDEFNEKVKSVKYRIINPETSQYLYLNENCEVVEFSNMVGIIGMREKGEVEIKEIKTYKNLYDLTEKKITDAGERIELAKKLSIYPNIDKDEKGFSGTNSEFYRQKGINILDQGIKVQKWKKASSEAGIFCFAEESNFNGKKEKIGGEEYDKVIDAINIREKLDCGIDITCMQDKIKLNMLGYSKLRGELKKDFLRRLRPKITSQKLKVLKDNSVLPSDDCFEIDITNDIGKSKIQFNEYIYGEKGRSGEFLNNDEIKKEDILEDARTFFKNNEDIGAVIVITDKQEECIKKKIGTDRFNDLKENFEIGENEFGDEDIELVDVKPNQKGRRRKD